MYNIVIPHQLSGSGSDGGVVYSNTGSGGAAGITVDPMGVKWLPCSWSVLLMVEGQMSASLAQNTSFSNLSIEFQAFISTTGVHTPG